MRLNEKAFLGFTPGVFPNVWVKFIVPPTSFIFDFLPFSTLLAVSLFPEAHVVEFASNVRPAFGAYLLHRLLKKFIFLQETLFKA